MFRYYPLFRFPLAAILLLRARFLLVAGVIFVHQGRRTDFDFLAFFASDPNNVGAGNFQIVFLAELIQLSQMFGKSKQRPFCWLVEQIQLSVDRCIAQYFIGVRPDSLVNCGCVFFFDTNLSQCFHQVLCELSEMLSLNPAASMGFVQRYFQIGFGSTERDGKERDLHLLELIDRGRRKERRQQWIGQYPLIERRHQPLDRQAAPIFS